MADVLQYSMMTLAEALKKEGFDPGSIGEIQKDIALMNGTIPWLKTTHGMMDKRYKSARLAAGAFVDINDATPQGNSLGEIIPEPVKLYELESIVDERLLIGLTGEQKAALRDAQDMENMEGALQGFAAAVINGNNGTDPKALYSFAQRRNALGKYCIGGSGTGSDVSSVYFIQFGPKGLFFGYPGDGSPGIKTEDMGRNRVTSGTGSGSMYAWCRKISVWAAIILRDERALIRYANIESAGSSNIFSTDTALSIRNKLPQRGKNAIGLANRDILTQIDQAAYNKTNLSLSIRDIEGFGNVSAVGGIPMLLDESILSTETNIS